MESKPLWRDISKHQGIWNPSVSKMGGVQGVAIRAAISWGYRDPLFKQNYANAVGQMYRTSYHLFYSDQPVISQANNWFEMHPEIEIIPRVIDLEVDRGVSAGVVANNLWSMSNAVFERDGVRPIIYSRYMLVDKWLASWSDVQLNLHYWWLAQYVTDRSVEHPGPPALPKRVRWDRIILHQTADKKAPFPSECDSKAIDYDRWQFGDVSEMHEWIANAWGAGSPLPLTLEQKVDKLWKYHPELH